MHVRLFRHVALYGWGFASGAGADHPELRGHLLRTGRRTTSSLAELMSWHVGGAAHRDGEDLIRSGNADLGPGTLDSFMHGVPDIDSFAVSAMRH